MENMNVVDAVEMLGELAMSAVPDMEARGEAEDVIDEVVMDIQQALDLLRALAVYKAAQGRADGVWE